MIKEFTSNGQCCSKQTLLSRKEIENFILEIESERTTTAESIFCFIPLIIREKFHVTLAFNQLKINKNCSCLPRREMKRLRRYVNIDNEPQLAARGD